MLEILEVLEQEFGNRISILDISRDESKSWYKVIYLENNIHKSQVFSGREIRSIVNRYK